MKKKILYISGEGHSGSTLLDILLGSNERVFSVGELTNLPQKGMINGEYCSCGEPVPKCRVWKKVIEEWNQKRILDLNKYLKIQKALTSNKRIFSRFKQNIGSAENIHNYIKDKELLYDIIFRITNSNVIIDSSKNPHNIPIIKKTRFEIEVIHLVRRFGDVLNSYKRKHKKNLAQGIEEDIKPSGTYYILMTWLLKNTLTFIYSRNTNYKLVRYEDLVTNPITCLSDIINHDFSFEQRLKKRGPFYPRHLVAGNRIRMKDHIFISQKPMDTSYHRLNKLDQFLARSIDFFY